MDLRDYFVGKPFELHSPLSAIAVADRINNAAGSAFNPFATGAVGGVRFGHVRLRYQSSPLEYNAKPVLSGRVLETLKGSCIKLRYRAPVWVYGFYIFWYISLISFAGAFLLIGINNDSTGIGKALTGAFIAGLFISPIAIHKIGTLRSNEDLANLLGFLSQQAEAEVCARAPPHS